VASVHFLERVSSVTSKPEVPACSPSHTHTRNNESHWQSSEVDPAEHWHCHCDSESESERKDSELEVQFNQQWSLAALSSFDCPASAILAKCKLSFTAYCFAFRSSESESSCVCASAGPSRPGRHGPTRSHWHGGGGHAGHSGDLNLKLKFKVLHM